MAYPPFYVDDIEGDEKYGIERVYRGAGKKEKMESG